MITKKEFIKLYHQNTTNDKIKFSFSEINEEGIFEFQVFDSLTDEILFSNYDNRIHLSTLFDIDADLIGRFDYIDSNVNELVLIYEDETDFSNDIKKLLNTYQATRKDTY